MGVKCCKNCALWDRASAADARGAIRKDRYAKCQWVPMELPPASIRGPHAPSLSYMCGGQGTDCPQFIQRNNDG